MTDLDRYDLDLLEALGRVEPPTADLLDHVAARLHGLSMYEAPTASLRRPRRAVPVAAALAVAAVAAAVGMVSTDHTGKTKQPASPAATAPTAAGSLRDAILAAFSNTGSDISHSQVVWQTKGQQGAIDVWTSPFEAQIGQTQTRRDVVSVGGQTIQDVEMVYAIPKPETDATVPADCQGKIGVDKSKSLYGPTGGVDAVDGRLIDVEYTTKSWSDQPETCLAVAQPTDAQQVRDDVATGGWSVVAHGEINGRQAIELGWSDHASVGSTDVLWVDAQTYLPIVGKSTDQVGSPGAYEAQTITTTYDFLADTPANEQQLTTHIPAGFAQSQQSPGISMKLLPPRP
jgi:hypothetical protein